MRYSILVGALSIFLFLILGGCQDEPTVSVDGYADFNTNPEVITDDPDSGSTDHHNPNFGAILSGDREVPGNDSKGHGVAKMKINPTKDEIHYFLNVTNVEDVVAAHIHRGGYGVNGPVVATLYTAAPGGGRTHGRLTEGTITPGDLVGPFAGSTDFDFFIDELHLDSLYVNVHSEKFPGGEIRGQLRSAPYGGIGVKAPHR